MSGRLPAALLLALALVGASRPAGAEPSLAPDRTHPPSLGEPRPLVLPPVQVRHLSNGIPVWLLPRPAAGLASVVLVSKVGAGQDPPGQAGLAALAAACLEEGAGGRGPAEFAEAVEELGASLGASASLDGTLVELAVPSARLHAGLDLMADLVLRPALAEEEIERLQALARSSAIQERRDPERLARAAFLHALYGPGHRYGLGLEGSPAQLSALGREDLRAFLGRALRPERVVLVATGGIEPGPVVEALEARFGSWAGSGELAPLRDPGPPDGTAPGIYLVDRPGAAQSVIRAGVVGVSRSAPDVLALEVGDTVLGGSFTSRLNQNLRERNQFTYGASSAFLMRRGPGPFLVSTAVQADATGPAVMEILGELARALEPIPQAELEKARAYRAYTAPAGFETSRDLALKQAERVLYDLPEEVFAEEVPGLLAVTPEQVQAAMARVLDLERLVVVVVGDASEVGPELERILGRPVRRLPLEAFLEPLPEGPAPP